MKILITILALLSITSFGHATESDTQINTGNDFLKVCHGAFVADISKLELFENVQLISCGSYLNGIEGGIGFYSALLNKMSESKKFSLPYCIPANVPITQKAKIIKKFLDEHPEQLHEPAVALYFVAMVQAFPCETQDKKK